MIPISFEAFVLERVGKEALTRMNQGTEQQLPAEARSWAHGCCPLDDDVEARRLLAVASEQLCLSPSLFLEAYGMFFIRRFLADPDCACRIQNLGSNIVQLANRLGELISTMAMALPGLSAPGCFLVDQVTPESLLLLYHSDRFGLWPFVGGVLRAVAQDCFGHALAVDLEQGKDHQILKLRFPRLDPRKSDDGGKTSPAWPGKNIGWNQTIGGDRVSPCSLDHSGVLDSFAAGERCSSSSGMHSPAGYSAASALIGGYPGGGGICSSSILQSPAAYVEVMAMATGNSTASVLTSCPRRAASSHGLELQSPPWEHPQSHQRTQQRGMPLGGAHPCSPSGPTPPPVPAHLTSPHCSAPLPQCIGHPSQSSRGSFMEPGKVQYMQSAVRDLLCSGAAPVPGSLLSPEGARSIPADCGPRASGRQLAPEIGPSVGCLVEPCLIDEPVAAASRKPGRKCAINIRTVTALCEGERRTDSVPKGCSPVERQARRDWGTTTNRAPSATTTGRSSLSPGSAAPRTASPDIEYTNPCVFTSGEDDEDNCYLLLIGDNAEDEDDDYNDRGGGLGDTTSSCWAPMDPSDVMHMNDLLEPMPGALRDGAAWMTPAAAAGSVQDLTRSFHCMPTRGCGSRADSSSSSMGARCMLSPHYTLLRGCPAGTSLSLSQVVGCGEASETIATPTAERPCSPGQGGLPRSTPPHSPAAAHADGRRPVDGAWHLSREERALGMRQMHTTGSSSHKTCINWLLNGGDAPEIQRVSSNDTCSRLRHGDGDGTPQVTAPRCGCCIS